MSGRLATVLLAVLLSTGCAAKQSYRTYFEHEPRSILVVPPLNETTAVNIEPIYMTTVSVPFAERGFYVFPVHLSDLLLRDIGLPEAGLVHQLPLERFRELFGADAVLFVTIKDWSTKYVVIQSSTVVSVSFELKDTRTGAVLWAATQSAARSSGDGGGGLVGAVISAAVTYAINQMIEIDYRPLAVQANYGAIVAPSYGLPFGPYHPDFASNATRYAR